MTIMPLASSAPLSMPGSTSLSTHASNEPYQTVKGNGCGFRDGVPDAPDMPRSRLLDALFVKIGHHP